jgi:hypothetical protein
LVWVVLASAALAAPARGQVPLIDTLALRAHTRFLADDLLAGRATGSPGADIAALYIESQCRALGLEPVGQSYVQEVPLAESRVLAGTSLTASSAPGTVEFLYPSDFTPNIGTAATLTNFEGATVFVGTEGAVESGQLGPTDIGGRVAVTAGPFRGPAADSLAARGVVGVIQLIADPETFALYRRSRGETRLYHRDSSVQSSFLSSTPSVLAGPRVARVLLSGATGGAEGTIGFQELGWTIRFQLRLASRPVRAGNVACLLRGSDPDVAEWAIVLVAHYDHLGISLPNAQGDSIYNGFSDNAAGVGMLLSIAGLLTDPSSAAPRHSVIFLFPTGEERGLLGSDFYVDRPLWPLERTAAVINLDAGAPPGRPVSWRLAGTDSTGLGGIAQRLAAQLNWRVTTSAARPNSDYFPFHRKGVPTAFIIPGPDPYEGLSADSSQALRDRWDRYHDPGDHWWSDFPFAGLARYAGFALLLLREVDRSTRP